MEQAGDRITAIAAATGWFAEMRRDGETDPNLAPLAFWQVVEAKDGWTEVVGVSPIGEGWSGQTVQEWGDQWELVQYVFDPERHRMTGEAAG